jgi:hypothetical protein
MHCSTTKWDFHFTDRETGRAHGFVYKKSHFIEPHVVSADEAGYPVDLVVRPLVLCQGDFFGPKMGNYETRMRATMTVAIDMFPEDEEEEAEA